MAKIHEEAFIAQGAVVLGDVTVEENASVWFHATVRGDRASVTIGKGSNVQDNCVLHVEPSHPVVIGENVTIGHSAIIHGAVIGDNTLIGMGAILMNGCRIGKNCVIGAGALITQNTIVPDNSLVLGNPGKVKREVTADEMKANIRNAAHYVTEAQEYKKGLIPQP